MEGNRDAEALLTGRASRFIIVVGIALSALSAGCGASPSPRAQVAASCKRQRAAVAAVGPVESLAQATRALRRTIALERRALADLRHAESNGTLEGLPELVSRLDLALADARRFQASIQGVDPTQSMTPLQVGAVGARRALDRASRVARATCRLAAG